MTTTARSCGECAACCTTTPVVPLSKPAGVPCRFQTGGDTPAEGRCACYAERPACCSAFRCEWLLGDGGDQDRPDRSGVVAEYARDEVGAVRIAMLSPSPGFSDEWPAFVAAIDRWRAAGAVVIAAGKVYASPDQLRQFAKTTFVFGDGQRLELGSGKVKARP